MGNKVILILFAALPAIFTFLLMRFLQDAVLTLVALLITYLLLIFVYHSFIESIGYQVTLAKEVAKMSDNISLGLKLLGAGVGLGLVGVLYCMFVPFGPTALVMPFPYNESKAKEVMYQVGFALLYLLRAPIEHLFYNYVIYSEYNEKGGAAGMVGGLTGEDLNIVPAILVCFFNALMQFSAFYFMISGILPAIIVTLIGFGINFGLLKTRVDKGIISSTLFSLGFALGVLLIFVYLNFTLKGTLKRKTPEFYFPANMMNCWFKWRGAGKTDAGSASTSDSTAAAPEPTPAPTTSGA